MSRKCRSARARRWTRAALRLDGALALPDDLFLGGDDQLKHVRRIWQEGLNVGLQLI